MSFFDSNESVAFRKALSWIFFSVVVICGTGFVGWLAYYYHLQQRFEDPQYQIIALMQETSSPQILPTVYLAELLDLSLDQPTNIYKFNLVDAGKKLASSPVIKEAHIKKVRPGTIYVHYHSRTPFAYLSDSLNTAIDEEGILFPFAPFYSPKKLPFIYLGWNEIEYNWGKSMKEDPLMQLAFNVIENFQFAIKDKQLRINKIDVSHAFAKSAGQREIVVEIFEEDERKRLFILRLNSKNYIQNIADYIRLYESMASGLTMKSNLFTIDMRNTSLAYVKE